MTNTDHPPSDEPQMRGQEAARPFVTLSSDAITPTTGFPLDSRLSSAAWFLVPCSLFPTGQRVAA